MNECSRRFFMSSIRLALLDSTQNNVIFKIKSYEHNSNSHLKEKKTIQSEVSVELLGSTYWQIGRDVYSS